MHDENESSWADLSRARHGGRSSDRSADGKSLNDPTHGHRFRLLIYFVHGGSRDPIDRDYFRRRGQDPDRRLLGTAFKQDDQELRSAPRFTFSLSERPISAAWHGAENSPIFSVFPSPVSVM